MRCTWKHISLKHWTNVQPKKSQKKLYPAVENVLHTNTYLRIYIHKRKFMLRKKNTNIYICAAASLCNFTHREVLLSVVIYLLNLEDENILLMYSRYSCDDIYLFHFYGASFLVIAIAKQQHACLLTCLPLFLFFSLNSGWILTVCSYACIFFKRNETCAIIILCFLLSLFRDCMAKVIKKRHTKKWVFFSA